MGWDGRRLVSTGQHPGNTGVVGNGTHWLEVGSCDPLKRYPTIWVPGAAHEQRDGKLGAPSGADRGNVCFR
jgi:hypothetical protein